ncbi:hypothetical protein CDAR_271091 [Caerostris darwini]|uniref:Uncharacterized protein n=1 Tax=Caerostris darwini TaxID=1538125 RepID=A0AAV4TEJ6_9ARAC|nr:hypothetical protein CDAR_271091 [Caerostris darwini]
MLLCTRNWQLEKVIEEKALVLWEKILRTPRYLTLWNLESPSQHCLKTQAGFLQEVLKLKDSYNLNSEFENLPIPRSSLDCRIFNVVTDLVSAVRKLDISLSQEIPQTPFIECMVDSSNSSKSRQKRKLNIIKLTVEQINIEMDQAGYIFELITVHVREMGKIKPAVRF